MAVGFGFSVGDFIAALGLVRDVIDALQDTGTTRIRYRQLLRQLYSLEKALQNVDRLELKDNLEVGGVERSSEIAALRDSAAQCQRSINEFFERIKHYIPHLKDDVDEKRGSLKRLIKKVQWSLCRKEDITVFQADITGHTESINLLIATIQMKSATIAGKKHEKQNQTLARRVQQSYSQCMEKLTKVSEAVQTGLKQGKQVLEITTNVIEINVRIFQTVLRIHHTLLQIPGQVERQQPVFLIDALGRSCPFHLEFIRSSEALLAVLEINFKKIEKGADKIRKNEFSIEDSATQQEIDLSMDWETCFQPGQRVEMAMLFDRPIESSALCPRCSLDCIGDPGEEVKCTMCGILFRRITEFEEPDLVPERVSSHQELGPGSVPVTGGNLKRRRDCDGEDLMPFRKIRIRTLIPLLGPGSEEVPAEQSDGYTINMLWALLQNCEDVTSGKRDMDELCSQLKAKTKYSESGPFIAQSDVEAILGVSISRGANINPKSQ